MIPEQHDIEHYAWMDDVDDTRGLEIEISGLLKFCTLTLIASFAAWAVWG